MDKLKLCAINFNNLLNIEYKIIIGRKNKSEEINLKFSKVDFHHLIGIGKLKSLYSANENREKVFKKIIADKLKYTDLIKDERFINIQNRFEPLSNLEKLIDNNELIFKYNKSINKFSSIQAKYLLVSTFNNNDIYIFLDTNKENKYFCKSFFPKDKKDYSERQPKYKLLYKEKINKITNEKFIQYDILK